MILVAGNVNETMIAPMVGSSFFMFDRSLASFAVEMFPGLPQTLMHFTLSMPLAKIMFQ